MNVNIANTYLPNKPKIYKHEYLFYIGYPVHNNEISFESMI